MLAGAMVLAMSTVSKAQSDNITAVAEVVANLEVSGERNLDFSQVARGLAKTIAADNDGDVTTTGPSDGDETSGRFDITGPAGVNITIRFTSIPAQLEGQGDAEGESLEITYTSNWANFETIGTLNPVDVGEGVDTDINDFSGEVAVFLGGTVDPGAEQELGTYQAEITLEAVFN